MFPITVETKLRGWVSIAVVLVGILMFIAAFSLILLLRAHSRQRSVLKVCGPFLQCSVIGCMLWISQAIMMTRPKVSDSTCLSIVWLYVLGFGSTFGPLVFRSWRMFYVFWKARSRNNRKVSRPIV